MLVQADLPRPRLRGRRWRKARRALAEFRIRGVATNIPFLQAVLDDPDFAAGRVTTSFIETHPQLLKARRQRRPRHQAADLPRRRHRQPAARRGAGRPSTRRASCPPVDLRRPAPDGTRQLLLELGPEGFARRLREQNDVAVTDTTFRDAHQSLLATRVRTRDLLAVAGHVARMHPGAAVARVLGRRDLRRRAALPGRGPVGAARRAAPGDAEHLPADAAARPQHGRLHALPDRGRPRAFVQEAAETGIDVFRIFDALNDVEQMRPAIEAVRETGTTVAEVALCYTGDLSSPGREALHPRLLPAARRADRRRRRARAGDQGHGRPAPRAGRAHPGHRPARAVRPARAPAHPRHRRAASSPPCSPRSTPASTRSTPPARRWPAPPRSRRCPRWSRATDHSDARDRPVARRGQRAGALLGGGAPGLRAVRVRAARHRPGASTGTRSPAGSSPTCGSRRSRSASARSSSRSRTCTPRPTTSSATSSRSRRRRRWSATSRCTWSALGADPAEFADDPGRVRHPRLGDRLPLRRARRPARRLAGAVPHQGARGPHLEAAGRASSPPSRRGAGRGQLADPPRDPEPSCCSPARPRSSPRPPQTVRRRLGAADRRLPLRPAATARSTRSTIEEGKTILLGLAGDQRARRARLPHA